MATTEQAVQELNRLAQLGSASGAPLHLPPPPLKQYAGSLLLLLLGAVGVVLALVLAGPAGQGREPAIAVGIVGALCLAAAGWNLYRRGAERCELALHQNGFALKRFGRTHVVPYGELRVFTVSEKESLSNGVRQGLRRVVSVRTPAVRLRFAHVALDGRADPLHDFLDAATDAIAAQLGAQVASGAALVGAGWQLDARGLRPGRGDAVPVSDISEAESYDRRLRAWRGIDARPFLSIPVDSANALVLRKILRAQLSERPGRSGPDGLGRVLFERRLGAVGVAVWALVAASAGVAALMLWRSGETTGGAALMAGAILLGAGLLARTKAATRFCERGIEKRSLLGSRTLRYAETTELSYSVTRHYHNGVYTGTANSVKLSGPQGTLAIGSQTRGSDPALESMRDFIATTVAQRLRDVVRAGGSVTWGDARITSEGVAFRRRRLMGMAKGEEVLIPHATNPSYSIRDGVYHLFAPGEKSAALAIPCSAKNFYPGLLLLGQLVAEATAPAVSRAES